VIESANQSMGYEGEVTIKFEVLSSKVVVRPDSRLSRALSNSDVLALLGWPGLLTQESPNPGL
jgi:hypothetical protein